MKILWYPNTRIEVYNLDLIIHFFRDTLDGPLYWIFVAICVLLILILLGYILDRTNKNKLEAEQIANAPTPSGKIEFGSKSDIEVKKELKSSGNIIDFTPSEVKKEEKKEPKEQQVIDFGNTATLEELTQPMPVLEEPEKLKNNEEIGVIDFSAPSTNTTATVVEEMSENTMQLPKIPPTEDISTPTDNIQSQASREEEITLTPANK